MLHIVQIFINYLIAHWPAIASLVGGGAGLSVALQFVLHKLRIDSKKVAYTLIHLFSIGAALAAYYLSNTNVLPAYAGLVIAAQTVHRFAVSPYYNKYILPYLNFLSEQSTSQPQPLSPAPAQKSAPAASFVS
jgi:hypothetical protein